MNTFANPNEQFIKVGMERVKLAKIFYGIEGVMFTRYWPSRSSLCK